VKAGQPVQLTLSNTGQMQHDWSLDQGAAQPVEIVANAGQTATGTFTIPRPGTYTFVCSVPGHAAAGMKGTITAQ
jgi:nitrite reductase (NO-forming)